MDETADWATVNALGATIVAATDLHETLGMVLRRLAGASGALVEVWQVRRDTGQLAYLMGSSATLRPPETGEEARARQEAVATRRIVTGQPGGTTSAFLALPLIVANQVEGVVLARATVEPERLTATEPLFARLAPFLGLLVHALLSDSASAAEGRRAPLATLHGEPQLRDNLRRELARARRTRASCALLLVGLDRPDEGAPADEPAPHALAGVLHHACRDTDIIARYGDEQLAVLLPNTDGPGAQRAANRLLDQIFHRAALTDAVHDQPPRVSIGIAVFPVDGFTADELLNNATYALAEARRLGGNRTAAA